MKGEQAAFNARLDETLAEAQADTPRPSTSRAFDRVRKTLDRGRELIAQRQKLIRIADRSEIGWSVVAEYTSDELPDDSEGEKRLEKAPVNCFDCCFGIIGVLNHMITC